jgi:hypothetical protein
MASLILRIRIQVFLGPLEVTGKITFIMEDDTELTRFLNNTQPAIVLTGLTVQVLQQFRSKQQYQRALTQQP